MDIHKINEIATRQGEISILMKYIKMFYDEAKVVDKEPNWEECYNIQFSSKFNMIAEEDLEPILNNFAGICQYKNKIPLEMVKFKNAFYLKVKEI